MRVNRAVCVTAAVLWLVATVAFVPSRAVADDKVSLRLDWIPGVEHAFAFLAEQKGWFKEEGIDLEILPGQGSTVSVKLVGNRENDFAFSDGATLVQAWQHGVPLVSLMVLYHDTPTVVVAKDGSPVKALKDICGKKMGVMIKSTTYAQFKGMLAAANIKCSFEEVPASPGGRELLSGIVAAQHHYGFLIGPLMKLKDAKVHLIPATNYFHFYSQTIITNEALLKENKALVGRFMKALTRGLRYSIDHPDEALAALVKARKETKVDYEKLKQPLVNQLFLDPGPQKEKLGMQSADGWKQSAETLAKIKITKSVVDTKGRFTNEFIQ